MKRCSGRGQDKLTSKLSIKTDMIPTTAFSGEHESEDSLAIATAILAAAYAFSHPMYSPQKVVPSLNTSRISQDGGPMEKATAVAERASALKSL